VGNKIYTTQQRFRQGAVTDVNICQILHLFEIIRKMESERINQESNLSTGNITSLLSALGKLTTCKQRPTYNSDAKIGIDIKIASLEDAYGMRRNRKCEDVKLNFVIFLSYFFNKKI